MAIGNSNIVNVLKRRAKKAEVNRASLALGLCERFALSKSCAKGIVGFMVDAMAAALERGERIEFRGFGGMKISARKGTRYDKKVLFTTHPAMLVRINRK